MITPEQIEKEFFVCATDKKTLKRKLLTVSLVYDETHKTWVWAITKKIGNDIHVITWLVEKYGFDNDGNVDKNVEQPINNVIYSIYLTTDDWMSVHIVEPL